MPNESTQPEDTTEVLVPSAEIKSYVIGPPEDQYELFQRPLSFFGKIEVFSVLGTALDKAMAGPDGLSLSELLDGPRTVDGELNASNFQDADTFVKAIAKLLEYAPDLFLNLYVVILGVPRGNREKIKLYINQPEELGGISDDDGWGIIDTFIDQNWSVMVDFFGSRIQPLIQKVSNQVEESQPSKQSKNTRRTTAKQ